MPLLHPSQRKSFTINKDTATLLARRLANGENLKFQSSANRNWVAKIARTRYGVATKVRVSKDALIDPRHTVEGKDLPNLGIGTDKHYMTLYVAERDYSVYDAPIVLRNTSRDSFGQPVKVHVGEYGRYTGW
jgi:hypothetical protein